MGENIGLNLLSVLIVNKHYIDGVFFYKQNFFLVKKVCLLFKTLLLLTYMYECLAAFTSVHQVFDWCSHAQIWVSDLLELEL